MRSGNYRPFKEYKVLTLEGDLYRDRTWVPEFLGVTEELVCSAIREGVLTPEDVSLLLVSSPSDPAARVPHFRLLLFRLVTEGAPVQ